MRIPAHEMSRIAGSRYGFMIADLVLRDTLDEFVFGPQIVAECPLCGEPPSYPVAFLYAEPS